MCQENLTCPLKCGTSLKPVLMREIQIENDVKIADNVFKGRLRKYFYKKPT
jgi:hypothetical protein